MKYILILTITIVLCINISCTNRNDYTRKEFTNNDIKKFEKSSLDESKLCSDIMMSIKEKVVSKETLKITLINKNTSNTLYSCSRISILEFKKDELWYIVPLRDDVGFLLDKPLLSPESSNEEEFLLTNYRKALPAGKYRIIKEFTNENDDKDCFSFIEFNIE